MENWVKRAWVRVQSFFLRQHYHGVSQNRTNEGGAELCAIQRPDPALTFSSNLKKVQSTPTTHFHEQDTLLQSSGEQISVEPIHDPSDIQHPGWISGVNLCAKIASGILFINIIFIAVAAGLARKHPTSLQFSTSQVFYEGSCNLTKRWNVALHFIINILSTGILAASNYCMQSLVAPTREEVDACHAQGKWLDIGTASIRNLFSIEKRRIVLWLALMITATPFHLLYNSMVFESLGTNLFGTYVGPRDLTSENIGRLTTPGLEKCFAAPAGISGVGSFTWDEFSSYISDGSYTRLSLTECESIATDQNAAGTKALIVLVNEISVNDGGNQAILWTGAFGGLPNSNAGTLLSGIEGTRSFSLVNTSSETYVACTSWKNSQDAYEPGGTLSAQECLSIPTDERCQLLYNPTICIIISLTALAKIMAMFLAARIGRSKTAPLLTRGDAVASFVSRPDSSTEGQCWLSNKDVHNGDWKVFQQNRTGMPPVLANRRGTEEQSRYKKLVRRKWQVQVPSKKKWVATLFLCLSCIGAGVALFEMALGSIDDGVTRSRSLSASRLEIWWELGFNAGSSNIITLEMPLTMLGSVVLANVPQLALTLSYYCYNNVVTDMLAAREYSSYGASRKPLRVTWPAKGSRQRSTYWLSVPYQYAAPILLIYGILHWLVSQSIYYVLVIPYDMQGNPSLANRVSALGYSPLPIFLSILVGSLMICILIGISCQRLQSDMPLAGSCSAAISAACHPPKDEDLDTAILGPIKWGQAMRSSTLGMNHFNNEIDDENGHCSFTALDTVRPNLTKSYA
ncbi:hypothetical protein N7499_009524 [Penicillium canescens]|nr:hypothetical protein N7499_009524 [Penicillium canescens]KAJ6170190.1 hypothetical protein N7485_007536 [Penicillium canescens]